MAPSRAGRSFPLFHPRQYPRRLCPTREARRDETYTGADGIHTRVYESSSPALLPSWGRGSSPSLSRGRTTGVRFIPCFLLRRLSPSSGDDHPGPPPAQLGRAGLRGIRCGCVGPAPNLPPEGLYVSFPSSLSIETADAAVIAYRVGFTQSIRPPTREGSGVVNSTCVPADDYGEVMKPSPPPSLPPSLMWIKSSLPEPRPCSPPWPRRLICRGSTTIPWPHLRLLAQAPWPSPPTSPTTSGPQVVATDIPAFATPHYPPRNSIQTATTICDIPRSQSFVLL